MTDRTTNVFVTGTNRLQMWSTSKHVLVNFSNRAAGTCLSPGCARRCGGETVWLEPRWPGGSNCHQRLATQLRVSLHRDRQGDDDQGLLQKTLMIHRHKHALAAVRGTSVIHQSDNSHRSTWVISINKITGCSDVFTWSTVNNEKERTALKML